MPNMIIVFPCAKKLHMFLIGLVDAYMFPASYNLIKLEIYITTGIEKDIITGISQTQTYS